MYNRILNCIKKYEKEFSIIVNNSEKDINLGILRYTPINLYLIYVMLHEVFIHNMLLHVLLYTLPAF